jgi:hypothetical protein
VLAAGAGPALPWTERAAGASPCTAVDVAAAVGHALGGERSRDGVQASGGLDGQAGRGDCSSAAAGGQIHGPVGDMAAARR